MYSALHTSRKNQKGWSISIYVYKNLKCSIRDGTDTFDESVGKLSIEILNAIK